MSLMKVLCGAAMALTAGTAFAAQNVANTSQKGSLLIWPLITVDKGQTTLIEISNDANRTVHVECEYVNEQKGRVNFDFDLSAKQTGSWDVYSTKGDQVSPAKFPTNPGLPFFPGNAYRGELICFAVNDGREFQIAWNHLTGTATVVTAGEPPTAEAVAPKHAFKYNAWSFTARNRLGPAPDAPFQRHGVLAGFLNLSGAVADGVYDACPAYNIANFMPTGAELAGVKTLSNSLAVVSCSQDLRERYNIYATKLEFTVWNSLEHSFTGAHYCTDSVTDVYLSDPPVTAGSNFSYDVLHTPNARFQVRGVNGGGACLFPTRTSGLLGVLYSEIAINGSEYSDATIGNTLHGAGALPGFIRWDPSGPVQLKAPASK